MSDSSPRLSIGLPVFNGERHLKEAVDSLLSQTFSDFELIICDNASTDRTPEICQAYASKDDRIRYYRNSENIGAVQNWYRTFELSSGAYFAGAAHDDVYHPEFMNKCIAIMDENPRSRSVIPRARLSMRMAPNSKDTRQRSIPLLSEHM